MNNDKRKKVYHVLTSETGYNDSFEDFNKFMNDSGDARRKVYDVLREQTGYNDSFEDFEKFMSGSPKNAETAPETPVLPMYQPGKEWMKREDSDVVPPQLPPAPAPWPEKEKREALAHTDEMLSQVKQASDEFRKYAENNREYLDKSGLGQVVEGKRRFNPASGKIEQTYLTPFGNRYNSKAEAERHSQGYIQKDPEYAETFGEGIKQGWKSLKEGVKYFIGETANLVTGSSLDDAEALQHLGHLERTGQGIRQPLAKEERNYHELMASDNPNYMPMTIGADGKLRRLTEEEKQRHRDILKDDDSDRLIRDAIAEAGGNLTKAKQLLSQRAGEMSWGDKLKASASEEMSKLKPTRGFGAWVGNLIPQMIPSAAGIAVSVLTRNPKYSKLIGGIGMGTMSASTAGQSMKEARDAGASTGQVWAVGHADGAIEYATEKLPFDRYTGRLFKTTKGEVGRKLAEAVADVKSPAKNEMERLLTEANRKLGGRLLNGRNIKEYVTDIVAEGASEFTAEALETITDVIYEKPEDYPTIGEILQNGWEGAKAGLFMGAVLGGASKSIEHEQQRSRRKKQGFVDVAMVRNTDDGPAEVAEIVGMNRDSGNLLVLDDGKVREVKPESIVEGYRFSFEEFDKGVLQMEADESFDNGYSLETPQEMTDAKNMLDYQRQRMINDLGVNDEALNDNAIDWLAEAQTARNSGTETGKKRAQAIIDYLNARQVYDGMMQRVRDDIDGRIAQSDAQTDARTHLTTGKIQGATMKQDGRRVYVVNGSLVQYEDKSGIDINASDGSIIIRDAETGKLDQVSPDAILNIDEPQDPAELKAVAAETIRQQAAKEADDRIDGVATFNAGDTYTITGEDGKQAQVQIVANEQGAVDNGDGTVNVSDGTKVFPVSKEVIQQQVDAANMARVAEFEQQRAAERATAEQAAREASRPHYVAGDRVTMRDADGNVIHGEIAEHDMADDKFVVDVDTPIGGRYVVNMPREQLDGMVVEHNGKPVEKPATDVTTSATDDATLSTESTSHMQPSDTEGAVSATDAATPSTDNATSATDNTTSTADVATSATPAATPATDAQQPATDAQQPAIPALDRIPKDAQGNPVFEQAETPDLAWDGIVELAKGNEESARKFVAEVTEEKETALKNAEKEQKNVEKGSKKNRNGLTPAERMAAIEEEEQRRIQVQEKVDAARKELEIWKRIAGTANRRKQEAEAERRRVAEEAREARKAEEEKMRAEREEAERIEREALNGVPDMVGDTPQDARARGYRRVNGHKVDRQEPVQALQGKEVAVKFSDDIVPTGHTALIDVSQLQPSHIGGRRNPLHFIDEAQPKERNDKASIMSASRIAGNIRPEEITSSVTAYTGAPTVNTRGEVIQGNNRSAALKEMWDTQPEQAAKYKQYLIDHAQEFGLNAEDVAAVERPVLVTMLDVNDAEAVTLGQYVSQDTESGGTERIRPKNVLQRMGADMRTFANMLLNSSDEDTSIDRLADNNGTEVLKWMQRKGYISPTQYNSAFDSKGNLARDAKNDLKDVLYESIFQGGGTNLKTMFDNMPAKAQRAILATAFRDFDSPDSERMIEEVQDSIRAYHALSQYKPFAEAKNWKEARLAAEAWKRQYQLDDVSGESYLPAENFSNFALHLATMYRGESQSYIQSTFNKLYDLIQGTQEPTLLDQPDNTPRTLAQAIKEVLNIDYNGRQRKSSNAILGMVGNGSDGREQGGDGSASPGGKVQNGERSAELVQGDASDSGETKTERNIQKPLRGSDEVYAGERTGSAERQAGNGSDRLRNDEQGGTEGSTSERESSLYTSGSEISTSSPREVSRIDSDERVAMQSRIVDWLSEENLSLAFGKTREEIFDEFGNELMPIACIPAKYMAFVGSGIKDPRIYCGKGYFIDHALRNHGNADTQIPVENVDVSKYLNIQTVLDSPDSIKETSVDGKRTVVFIKKIGRYFAELTQVEDNGRIVLHKSLFNQKKEPYAKLNDIRFEKSSSEGGVSSISHADKAAPAISLQSRDDVISQETVAETEPQQPTNAESSDSSLPESSRSGIPLSEPNGEPTVSSESEDTAPLSEKQEKGEENSADANEEEEKKNSNLTDANRTETTQISDLTGISTDKDSEKSGKTSGKKKKAEPVSPRQLGEAYESGDVARIAEAEKAIRDYIESQEDIMALANTYHGRKGEYEYYAKKTIGFKETPRGKLMSFLAEVCKESLMRKYGVPKQAFGSVKTRAKLASETTDPNVLAVMANDRDSDVKIAVINNPNTSDELLRYIIENNHYNYPPHQEAEEALKRRGVKPQRIGENAPVTKAEKALRSAIVGVLRKMGLKVFDDAETGQRVLDWMNGKGIKKSVKKPALPEDESSFKGTVIPFTDTANIRKNLDELASEYENLQNLSVRNVIADLGRALGAEHKGSKSQYITIEAKNGDVVTIPCGRP